jgi:hypothetical protein
MSKYISLSPCVLARKKRGNVCENLAIIALAGANIPIRK